MDPHLASSSAHEPSSPPDVMNDPAYATNTKTRDKHGEDGDTCRICRGEGSPEEPLFYPCKCSGSIKFVHQDCLMEWLSHSQKKHCELCKTPFRFTKLYHPHMPSSIPTTVFLRRAMVHVLKLLMTWCRIVLVASVWLVLLPWCMRVVWRSLFWVGDGGWSREVYLVNLEKDQNSTSSRPLDVDAIQSALDAAISANDSLALLPTFLRPFSQTLNMSAGEPTAWTLIRRFFFGMSLPFGGFSGPEVNITDHGMGAGDPSRNLIGSPSLLSDITFLRWFASPTANRFLLDVLEGQIITLLVVIAFILIFLIREWVVQQQPVINMAAAGADNAAAAGPAPVPEDGQLEENPANDRDLEVRDEGNQDLPGDDLPLPNQMENQDSEEDSEEEEDNPNLKPSSHTSQELVQAVQAVWRTWENNEEVQNSESAEVLRSALTDRSVEDLARIIDEMPPEVSARLKEMMVALSEELIHSKVHSEEKPEETHEVPQSGDFRTVPSPVASGSEEPSKKRKVDFSDSSPPPQRPEMPTRGRSFIATEIRRSLEERRPWLLDNDDVLHEGNSEVPESWEDDEPTRHHGEFGLAPADHEKDSDHSSDSWQHVLEGAMDEASDPDLEAHRSKSKGKEKALDENVNTPTEDAQKTVSSHEESTPRLVDAEEPNIHTTADAVQPEHPDPGADGDTTPNAENEVNRVPPPELQALRPHAQQQAGFIAQAMDWLWGDIAPENGQVAEDDGANDEHVVQNLADEAPFVPFVANEPREPVNAPVQDAEVAAAAAEAGIDLNDQDAIDDAEDLEGIMELIGMQGPLTGLFQNAMFSAVLISATVSCAVWFPYLWGKVVLLFMGSPVSLFLKLPLQLIAVLADFVVDATLSLTAGVAYWCIHGVRWLFTIISLGRLSGYVERSFAVVEAPLKTIAESAMDRIGRLVLESSVISTPNYFRLSINSHAALRTIQNTTSTVFNQTGETLILWYGHAAASASPATAVSIIRQAPSTLQVLTLATIAQVRETASWIWASKSYKITLNIGQDDSTSTYSAVEQWSATDRLIAVFAGYAFFAVVGALYLRRGTPFTTSQQGRKIEAIITEVLQQAGGVLKVILIISIEMLAFPLYCGLLLDVALLPLFEDASLWSRWQFARENPWTSGFVHWFVGTCYMFHFALFVSMCRKIMRKGVLYFIRDPDDPTFHPVRDVLERSVTTQLRKIAFSALVYGGLVIVCLGGVVWTLYRASTGILPVRWANQTPSLEFPIDLLFYNFLTPLVIKIYKPSEGLHQMYQWWFRCCAKGLRLSSFLFSDKVPEEEGHHVRQTWKSWFSGQKGDVSNPVMPEDLDKVYGEHNSEVFFAFDGKYVRAPASDQVRVPKGEAVFVEVDKFNNRKDGGPEQGGTHARGSGMVTMVYIPPWFRIRIVLFVLAIWMFAATTGVGITIGPLLFGRYLFSVILPPEMEMNDIHAFSLGIYTLGALAYGAYQLYKLVSTFRSAFSSPLSSLRTGLTTVFKMAFRALRVGYVYMSLAIFIPCLFALILELYILVPLHAWLGPNEPHVVHILQDWTLGFLYARLAGRLLFADRASRPARAFAALIADGWTNPNASLATRCFLVPVLLGAGLAVIVPSGLAWSLNRTIWLGASDAFKNQVWRFSFPAVAALGAVVWAGKEGAGMVRRWRMVVRDEVYLIGERLHNFGEKRAAGGGHVTGVAGRVGEVA